MKQGFTTGSCSAAAAKAATYMLLTGKEKNSIKIETPKGIDFDAQIYDISISENQVSCAVIKDGGDDPDVTTGAHVVATVQVISNHRDSDVPEILIDGGFGVGRVTKPGLDQPVGNAAINHVPREMIEKEVKEVCEFCDFKGTISVVISVPEGEDLAEKTFNPRLGIVGGISILGTSGVVEPMSAKALIDTIRVELNQKKELGYSVAAVTPGNYGLDYMKRTYDYDLNASVKSSNFIGETIDMAAEIGFKKMLLTGHIGKLVKVAGGIMNTHSREADSRMEIMVAAALASGASNELLLDIMESVTTEDAISKILAYDSNLDSDKRIFEKTMKYLVEKIHFYLNKRAAGRMQVECILYSNDYGELARSEKAIDLLQEAEEWYIS